MGRIDVSGGFGLRWLRGADGPDRGRSGPGGCEWQYINPVLYILEVRLGFVLGTLFFAVAAVAQLFCGMSSVTSNSRMIYAFSRDGAVPFHETWHKLDRGRTPRNAIILAVAGAFILAIPTVWNSPRTRL